VTKKSVVFFLLRRTVFGGTLFLAEQLLGGLTFQAVKKTFFYILNNEKA
jgi:hypothetical protein